MSEQQIEEQEQEPVEEADIKADEPKGTEPVELTEEQQARFNRIYGNMKEYERQNAQLIADQRRLAKKAETLQERLERFEKDSAAQRREALTAQKAAAYQDGDIEQVLKIDEQISQIRDPEPIPEPEPEPQNSVPDHVVAQIQSWRNEIDESGAFLRPWANENHPRFQDFANLAVQIGNDPQNAHLDNMQVLEILDREARSRFAPKRKTQTVLSGNSDAPPREKGVTLTPEMKDISHKLYPKMSPKDAEARYARAMKEV